MIEVKNLTKKYGARLAVNDISFAVNDGEIVGFLGPNGAGKSTTMNIITGYLSSNEGTVVVDGHEILENPIQVKASIGYLPEQPPLYPDMSVLEYLGFMFDLKKVKQPRRQHIQDICERVGISDVSHRLIRNLSKGYKQRVGIAQALLGNPSLLILDEPTVGLDPKQIIEIRNLVQELGKQHTIILSSHILSEIQATCSRVIVINQGQIIADDTPERLSQTLSGDHRLTVRIAAQQKDAEALLKGLAGIVSVDVLGEKEPGAFDYLLESEPGTDVRVPLFEALAGKNWPLLGLRSNLLSLEEVFLQLTQSSESAQEPDEQEPEQKPEETKGDEPA